MTAEDLEAFDETRKWARRWRRRYVEVHPDTADAVWAELERLRAIEQRAREVRDDYGTLSIMTTWDVARYILTGER